MKVGQLLLLKPKKLVRVWEEKNQPKQTISCKFEKLKETYLNISSKRFDQAIKMPSNMLLGKVLCTPFFRGGGILPPVRRRPDAVLVYGKLKSTGAAGGFSLFPTL